MVATYLLLLSIPVAGVAYLLWDHKRKAAARDAASAGRLQEILGTVERGRAEHDPVSMPSPPLPPVEATPTAIYTRRDRVLDRSHTLVYYLLRTALPDYLIFVHVPLASILEPAPDLTTAARQESLRTLAARTIDFLVSDRNMQPVAVVELVSPAELNATAAKMQESWFVAAAVRHIALDASALPRKDSIRAIVLGSDAMATRAKPDAQSHES